MNRKLLYVFIALSIMLIGEGCSNNNSSVLIGDVDISRAVNLTSVDKSITFTTQGNAFAMDKKDFIYCVEQKNHRILKIDRKGKFVKQIGQKGNGNESLFNPMGIYIKDNLLWVLDHYGRKVKQFTCDGEFVGEFEIVDANITWEIAVDDEFVYLHTYYKDREKFMDRKLFTIYTKEGKKVKQIGDLLPADNYYSSFMANKVHFSVTKKKLYAGFENVPIIAGYDLDGNQILLKDLRELDLSEINAMEQDAKQKGVQSLSAIKGPRARVYVYCDGFSTDSDNHYFYSMRNTILHFDERFNLLERIKTKKKTRNSIFWKINRTDNSRKWGIISINRQIHLFKL
jgi:hypothetical protein